MPVGNLCKDIDPFRSSRPNMFLLTCLKRFLYFKKRRLLPCCTGAGPEGPA